MSLSPPLSFPSLPFPSFFSILSLLSILHFSMWRNLDRVQLHPGILLQLIDILFPFYFWKMTSIPFHLIYTLLLNIKILGYCFWYQNKNSICQVTLLKYFSKIAITWTNLQYFKLIQNLAITSYHVAMGLGINTKDKDGYLRMGYLFCSHNLEMQILNTVLHLQ